MGDVIQLWRRGFDCLFWRCWRWKVRDSGTGGGRPACATPQFFKLVPGPTEMVSAWGAYPSTSDAPPLYEQGTRTRFRRLL